MFLNRPVGIDLGTTNSAVAMLEPSGREILIYRDKFKRKVVPSVVGWDPEANEVLVGFSAWHRRGMEPEPVSSIKRKMGQSQTVKVGPNEWTPEQVSARILETLKTQMHGFCAEKLDGYELALDRAVITVPAYFDAPQIEATKRAGQEAGLTVLSLLQEPTAAAMYHAYKHDLSDGTFLVYDLGGGTFDVSVIRCMMGEYQVLGIHGDNYLGGDDFDRRFAEHLRKHLVGEGYSLDLDVAGNPDDATRFLLLTRIAQEVKEALSTSEFQYVGRRDIFEDHDGNSVTLELEVGREAWEELMLDYVEQTIECCRTALAVAGDAASVTLADIDHVLLVGGSTRVPLVQRKVAEAFCGEGKSKASAPVLDEPDTCVATGAAIFAANLGGLTVGDQKAKLAVNISSPLTTKRSTGRLSGALEGDNAESVVEVVLREDVGDEREVARCSLEDQRFKLSGIDLPDEGTYPYKLALLDAAGQELTALVVALFRGGDVKPMGSALSNPSVLAKDLYLEVVKLGRPDRKKLLDKGTSLPVDARFRFFTADQSGAVILRLMQNRLPIRTIHLEVPADLPVGTPVDLTIKVDEAMGMVAEGGVADRVFWAGLEPPDERTARSWDEIESLLDDAERVAAGLWGTDAAWFRSKLDYLKAGIREASRTDPDKLQVLVRRLDELMEDYRNDDRALTPSFDRFERLLTMVRRRVFRTPDGEKLLGLGNDEWRDRLDEIESRGTEAFDKRDQSTWSRVYAQIQATWESLHQDEHRFSNPESAEALTRSVQSAQFAVEQIKENLAVLVLSENEETRKLQQREKLAILDALGSEVTSPLASLSGTPVTGSAARTELERIHAAIRRIEKRLERLPSIGLVSEN